MYIAELEFRLEFKHDKYRLVSIVFPACRVGALMFEVATRFEHVIRRLDMSAHDKLQDVDVARM
jgi:hypothetical protein